MKLMVSLIRQLQLIGIKTNLESFAITILMEHMLNRNQLPLFLWVSKQWRNNPGLWAIPFTEFVAGGITMTRTGWQASGAWNGDSGTISLTGYTASCATGNSVSSIGGSAIAIGI